MPASAGLSCIQGNERADEAAKAALSSTVSTMKYPASDLNPELTKYCRDVWQTEWDGYSFNKLHSTLPNLISIIVHCVQKKTPIHIFFHMSDYVDLNKSCSEWS